MLDLRFPLSLTESVSLGPTPSSLVPDSLMRRLSPLLPLDSEHQHFFFNRVGSPSSFSTSFTALLIVCLSFQIFPLQSSNSTLLKISSRTRPLVSLDPQ